MKAPASKPIVPKTQTGGEGDDFKNTLAAMLAKGPMGKPAQKKVAAPVEEEKKEKIKLNVFDDDAEEEEEKVKQMAVRNDDEDDDLGLPAAKPNISRALTF